VLVFLDIETTGLKKSDQICSIGIVTDDGEELTKHYELINPQKKIPVDAMSIHHITNEMIEDKRSFEESYALEVLNSLNCTENCLISHNIEFDNSFLQRNGFVWQGSMIDTMKATKHLIPEAEHFSLQFLRYELKLYKSELKYFDDAVPCAHNALSDCLHVKMLYDYLQDYASFDELCDLTFERALITKFNFGKYNGKYIEYIAKKDRAYLEWLLGLVDIDEDLRYSVEHFLREKE
jgi:DNA polymerase III epsilon subunit-like protein